VAGALDDAFPRFLHQPIAARRWMSGDRLVKETWKGVRRQLGVAPDQKHPISAKDIHGMLDKLPAGLLGLRDRALITLGFAGAFRRSELGAPAAADITFVSEGVEAPISQQNRPRRRRTYEGSRLRQRSGYVSSSLAEGLARARRDR
jgi:integrase